MRVRLLGVAAGGGLPQWNCTCLNCQAARNGFIPSQTQSSIALSSDGNSWFLVNASPDVRAQLVAFPGLHPSLRSLRNNPFEAILLTNSDLDHTAGLLLLREGDPLHLHASVAVQRHLTESLSFGSILTSYCGIYWYEPPESRWTPLLLINGQTSGISYLAIPLPSPPPLYPSITQISTISSHAYCFRDERTQGLLLVAPDVFIITEELNRFLQIADIILWDGTFWLEEELSKIKSASRTSSAMGHLPIKNGSMEILAKCSARHRIYLHINNTNPIFQPDSPERKEVESLGIAIGYDGQELEL